MRKKIVILDTKIGNLNSLYNLLVKKVSTNVIISNSIKDVNESSHLILPGDASFEAFISNVKKNLPVKIIEKNVLKEKKPILGICAGMQVFAEKGYENGVHKGLGWINGVVKSENKLMKTNIGWKSLKILKKNKILKGLTARDTFYFLHGFSFFTKSKKYVLCLSRFKNTFPAIINKNNIYGFQFHPENSQAAGIKLLRNFFNKT